MARYGERIRALFLARFAGQARAHGLDPDDVLQDVYVAILNRNRGANPYDPARGGWSNWAYQVMRSTLHHAIERANNKTHQAFWSMGEHGDASAHQDATNRQETKMPAAVTRDWLTRTHAHLTRQWARHAGVPSSVSLMAPALDLASGNLEVGVQLWWVPDGGEPEMWRAVVELPLNTQPEAAAAYIVRAATKKQERIIRLGRS